MRRRIGWGIIGCGDVVERKAGPSLQEIPGSRLVAVMRRSADKAEDFARRHRVPVWTTNPKTVFEHPEVDAIYVATPPEHHLEYALAACEAGKACLVEKPAGRSAQELRQMLAAFRSAGLSLFVSYYRPQLPKFLAVREILRAGRLGPIVSVDYQWSSRPRPDDWRLSARSSGGGLFWDIGGHVLTLLDDWFGALELTGASAANVLARHEVEDAVALSFRTASGAVGTARWNSAAARPVDRLRIEGTWGCLELECGDCTSPLRLELDAKRLAKPFEPRLLRLSRKLAGRKRLRRVEEVVRFAPVPFVQRPMLEAVVERIVSGAGVTQSAESALRASDVMDEALEGYYGGRDDAFWERPTSRQSLRAQAARRLEDPEGSERHALTAEDLRRFEEHGYLGPFRSEAPQLDRIAVPARDSDDTAHLEDPLVFAACTDPAVVRRVAQLFGHDAALLFKSRLRVKLPASEDSVPWHQDVGVDNGGYLPDGSPVPTITVWMALDDATRTNGAMRVVPGSHRRLYGDHHRNIRAGLEASGALAGLDLESVEYFEARSGEFYLFHSWLIHGSGPNHSPGRRAILNMRFAGPGHDVEEGLDYVQLKSGHLGPGDPCASES